jgi:HPt (histidine-containing phosphotransfer) domain-containing protein
MMEGKSMSARGNRAASETENVAAKITYPVDLVHLSRQTLGDRELEKEVLGLFVNQSTLYLKRLQTAKSNKERKSVAHTILGSARGLGAWQVAEEAARFEEQCNKNADCKRLANAVDDANAYIREILN